MIAARDGSPAAKPVCSPATTSAPSTASRRATPRCYEGTRLLRGKPGTKVRLTVLRGNAADPHDVELTREDLAALAVKGRIAAPGTGYLRVPEFSPATADQLAAEVAALQKSGAARLVVDLRGNAFGEVEAGLDSARLFVSSGTLAFRQDRGKAKEPIAARRETAPSHCRWWCSPTTAQRGAAELFAGALQGNKRAEIIGERTRGRAARQKLVKLARRERPLAHAPVLSPAGWRRSTRRASYPTSPSNSRRWTSARHRRPGIQSSKRPSLP